MMNRIRFFLISILIVFIQGGIFAQQYVITGRVLTEDLEPVPGINVRVVGASSGVTTESGEFRIQLPADVEIGETIVLSVTRPGWVIKSPVQGVSRGEINVPRKAVSQAIDIIIVPKGSLSLLTGAGLGELLKEQASKVEIKEIERQSKFELLLSEQADYLGFDVSDLKDAIEEWISKVKTPLEKGLAAYYNGNFALAEQLIGQSLDREKDAEKYFLLGNAKFSQLKFASAERDYWAAINIQINYSEAMNMLGRVLSEQGKYEEALKQHRAALTIDEKVYGEEHLDVATALNNIGSALSSQGDYDGALEHLRRALDIFKKVYGDEHPYVALGLNNIGLVLHAHGDYDGALEHLRRALAIREKVYGEEHPYVATSLNNIGFVLYSQGDYVGAVEYYKRALAIKKKVYGEEHPDVATTLNNIGEALRVQGDYDRALEHLRRALAILKKVHGEEHPLVATTLNNIGAVQDTQGDYDGALEHYRRALAILKKVHGEKHPYVAICLNNIGFVLRVQGDYVEALEHYRRALAILKKVYGVEHPYIAASLNNIGWVYRDQEDYRQALEYFTQALAIRKKFLGDDHPDTKDVKRSVEEMKKKIRLN